ncbi:MAG: hypothetical protein U9N57_01215 [Pseudomonadota bacterium]|nr:hypothetical protein [Pseudomonadota bacterium]
MKKTLSLSAIIVMVLLFSTTASAAGLTNALANAREFLIELGKLIPLVAVIFGAASLGAGVWAFKSAGKQNSPMGWQVGGVVGILVGAILISWSVSTGQFQQTLFGEGVQNEFEAQVIQQ